MLVNFFRVLKVINVKLKRAMFGSCKLSFYQTINNQPHPLIDEREQ